MKFELKIVKMFMSIFSKYDLKFNAIEFAIYI